MAATYDVFISYAQADAEAVHRLAENLHQAGLEVFLDAWEIGPGDVFVHQLDRGLLHARNGILAVTPVSLSRPWVREEYAAMLARAVQEEFRLIPVLFLDAELPPFLANRVWVDLRQADGPVYEQKVRELVAALRGERRGPPPRTGELRPRPDTAFRAEGGMARRLRIGREEVVLSGDGEPEARHRHQGFPGASVPLLREWSLAPHREEEEEAASPLRAAVAPAPTRESRRQQLHLEIGAALTTGFLTGEAGEALRASVERAAGENATLSLGLEVTEELAGLPWETLRLPEPGGTAGAPLALHPNVLLYRASADSSPAPAIAIPGPLRVLVAIGSPEEQNPRGELLDMEAELGRILDAVAPARRERQVHVRILNRGTVKEIHAALAAERYHVLHISCHAGPGVLILEDGQGRKDPVDAARFADEVLVPGQGVPLVVLAGCTTALAVEGEKALPGLARELLARGVPAVLAMQASMSDRYATELGARFYEALATFRSPEPLAALSEARRGVERERVAGWVGVELAEWPTPALYLRGSSLPLYDPKAPPEKIEAPPEPRLADGVVVRKVGDFVGRRREERLALQALQDEQGAGVLLRGLGGAGKSSLAAEVVRWAGEEGWWVASLAGETSPDAVLAEIGRGLLTVLQGAPEDHPGRQMAVHLQRPDVDWEERFDLLSRTFLGQLPLLVLLDNFEDNLQRDGVDGPRLGPQVANDDLAELLARWLRNPGRSRFLLTCRYPIELPHRAHRRLLDLPLGPLSFAETRKLIWRLRGIDALPAAEQRRAYADVGGHPRALEYLDALLRGGKARFIDVADRMETALEGQGIAEPRKWMQGFEGDLNRALAEAVTLASGDVLLDRLLERLEGVPLSRELLLGASVYRVPVDQTGLAWQVGEVEEDAPNPEREERLRGYNRAEQEARDRGEEPSVENLGFSAEDLIQLEEDWKALEQPPLRIPVGVEKAQAALEGLGLLAGIDGEGAPAAQFTVHRWTASALAERSPEGELRQAHKRAASYWRWRVERLPQSRQEDMEQLLEARFHHRAAGEMEAAVEVTESVCLQLETWGAYRRKEQLCRETLTWLPERSEKSAAFLHELGLVAQIRGDYNQALSWYQKSLKIFEELGNRDGMAKSYHQLGRVAEERGARDQAPSWYQKSLKIFEELGNRDGMARSYHQLGNVDYVRGDYDQAFSWYQKSLKIKEELGDRDGMANSYGQLGNLALEHKDYGQALVWNQKALGIFTELGNRGGMASSYHQLGMVAQMRGDYGQALSWYQKSLKILEELGNRNGVASSYHQLGRIAQERGDHNQALSWYQKSLTIKEELGNRAGMANSYGEIGALYTERGSPEEAVPLNLSSLAIRLEIGSPEVRIDLYWLRRQRELLGEERFAALLREHTGEEGAEAVTKMLDAQTAGEAEA